MTIAFYSATFLFGLLNFSKRLAYLISSVTKFRFLSDIIIWGLVSLAWKNLEGGTMPFAAYLMSWISVAVIHEITKKTVSQEVAMDRSMTVGREQMAITIWMIAMLIFEHPIRWF